MSDAYEVLVALLETELGQVITNIHAAGHLQSIFSPAIVSRSGNNNNSSDNSPSELLPSSSPSASGANINSEQTVAVGGENGKNNNNDNNHDNNNAVMVMSGKTHQQDKTLDISTSNIPSSSSLHLIEQAKRNRLAAETAARLLLTHFSTSFEQVSHRSGYENNNIIGRQQQHVLFPDSPCESTSSISASNLSNISGESEQSLSPCADDEQGHISSGQTPKVEIGNEKTSSNDSPTSSTFRVSKGNGPNGYPSILTTLLPLLGHQKHGCVPSSPSVMGMESGIRHLISRLKSERDAVKQTVMELESESLESLTPSPKPSSPYYPNGSMWSPADARKMDLETAVLMQELMAMKEERAELRAQLFLLEKEKASLELRLRSHESQEEAYKVRINYLKSEIMDCKTLHSETYQQPNRNRNDIIHSQQQQQHHQTQTNGNNKNLETINNNNNNQNVNWERETVLKKRIHELATTLEKVTTSLQVREKQNQEMINELNRANGILMQTLDVAKKKYQNRIKKMEDQIVYVSERHAAQLRLFGERLPPAAKYHA